MPFDANAATADYIDALGTAALAQAQAYTQGSHWLILWGWWCRCWRASSSCVATCLRVLVR
jgi:uncharacterized membrane protein YccF (DUF307 family)